MKTVHRSAIVSTVLVALIAALAYWVATIEAAPTTHTAPPHPPSCAFEIERVAASHDVIFHLPDLDGYSGLRGHYLYVDGVSELGDTGDPFGSITVEHDDADLWIERTFRGGSWVLQNGNIVYACEQSGAFRVLPAQYEVDPR